MVQFISEQRLQKLVVTQSQISSIPGITGAHMQDKLNPHVKPLMALVCYTFLLAFSGCSFPICMMQDMQAKVNRSLDSSTPFVKIIASRIHGGARRQNA